MIKKFRIKDLREDNFLTQEQISKKLKINRKTYSDYETQRVAIPISLLIKLADFYGVNVGYLCGITNDKSPYRNVYPFSKERMIKNIKKLRLQNQYTQRKLSELLPCGHNTISQYETGKRMIPLEILICLAKIYNIPFDVLIGIVATNHRIEV